jgi:hypothetical protein
VYRLHPPRSLRALPKAGHPRRHERPVRHHASGTLTTGPPFVAPHPRGDRRVHPAARRLQGEPDSRDCHGEVPGACALDPGTFPSLQRACHELSESAQGMAGAFAKAIGAERLVLNHIGSRSASLFTHVGQWLTPHQLPRAGACVRQGCAYPHAHPAGAGGPGDRGVGRRAACACRNGLSARRGPDAGCGRDGRAAAPPGVPRRRAPRGRAWSAAAPAGLRTAVSAKRGVARAGSA